MIYLTVGYSIIYVFKLLTILQIKILSLLIYSNITKEVMATQEKASIVPAAANVKVVCRFRPLNEREKALGTTVCHDLLDDKTVQIKDKENKDAKEPLKFSFDKVFDTNTSQEEVYNYSASSIIDSIVQGFNGTIFAYGQTASGKTYTMQGEIA